jgi:hypothetical protein
MNGGANDICPAGFGVPTKNELELEKADIAFLNLPTAGYRNAKDAKIMEDKFVFLWTLSPAVDIVGGVKTPKAYYFNGRTFLRHTASSSL